MNGINYPFGSDGVVWFAYVAKAYSLPSIWDGIKLFWQDQGPVYFSIQLIAAKLFGFSYTHALWVQFILALFLCTVIFWITVRPATLQNRKELPNPKTWLFLFWIVTLGILATTGIFHTLPSNVFDFRLDLISPLFLTLGLVTFERRSWVTSLCFFIAAAERFHNLPVLLASLGVWTLAHGIELKRSSKNKRQIRKELWLCLKFPIIGIFLLLVSRYQQFYDLTLHYRGHFRADLGMDPRIFGYYDWKDPLYFKFYPRILRDVYINWDPARFLIGMVLLSIGIVYRKSGISALYKMVLQALPLLVGGITAFVLLTIDPARNNAGVLRYSLVPLCFWLAQLLILAVCQTNVIRKNPMITIMALLAFSCLGMITEGIKVRKFYRTFDQDGIRKYDIARQMDPIFQKMYALGKDLHTGATFNTEFNFNHNQWYIFLASHHLKPYSYTFSTGIYNYVPNFAKEELPRLRKLDFLAVGNDHCLENPIPLNRQYVQYKDEVSKIVREQCAELPLGVVHLENCDISVLKCNPE